MSMRNEAYWKGRSEGIETHTKDAWVRKSVRRAWPVLARAAIAGALCFPMTGLTHCSGGMCISVVRDGGAVIAAWAFGTLSDATQPDAEPCDLAHVCSLAISSNGGAGTGTGLTIKNDPNTSTQADPAPNLPFTLTETIDYPHPVTKQRGKTNQVVCYPANAVMTITVDSASTLVLDMVGQACLAGASSAQLIFTGSYFSDSASTGQFADVDGVGSASINSPSGLEGVSSQNMKASFLGQLKYI